MTVKELTNKEHKVFWQMVLASAVLIVGLCLVVAGFVVEPVGDIHPSVLTAFGEALSFVGAIIGIDYSYKKKKLDYESTTDEQ